MSDPQVKQKLADQGLTVAGDTPEHFRDYIGAETKKWAQGHQGRRPRDGEVSDCAASSRRPSFVTSTRRRFAQMLRQLLRGLAAAT